MDELAVFIADFWVVLCAGLLIAAFFILGGMALLWASRQFGLRVIEVYSHDDGSYRGELAPLDAIAPPRVQQ